MYLILCKVILVDEEKSRYKPTGQSILRFYSFTSTYLNIQSEDTLSKIIIANLISGYNRDVQLTKEPLLNSIGITMQSISIACVVLEGFNVNKENCKRALTAELFATEEVYKLVKRGKSFRSAYKEVALKYTDQNKNF